MKNDDLKIYESPDNGKTIYERPFGGEPSERKLVNTKGNELCIMCGKDTGVPFETHIDFRWGYVEGSGQLCRSCYLGEDRNLLTIEGRVILDTPNDADLGKKVRSLYWESKK